MCANHRNSWSMPSVYNVSSITKVTMYVIHYSEIIFHMKKECFKRKNTCTWVSAEKKKRSRGGAKCAGRKFAREQCDRGENVGGGFPHGRDFLKKCIGNMHLNMANAIIYLFFFHFLIFSIFKVVPPHPRCRWIYVYMY